MMKSFFKPLLLTLLSLFLVLIAVDARREGPPENKPAELSTAKAGNVDARIEKKVLLFFPYQPAMPHTAITGQAISKVFSSAADLNIELYIEYLDLNRFQEPAIQEQLLKLYAVKYGRQPMDLVMLTGEPSLAFWLKYRARILPDTPAVFYDIMRSRLQAYQLPPGITGVDSTINHVRSVGWLLQARPSLRRLIIVHGVGQSDQEDMEAVEQLKKAQDLLQGLEEISDWSDLPLAVIKEKAAVLPPSAVILYHLMFEDAAGNKYRPLDALRELAQVSAVPVLSSYSHFIGTGSIGGCMYSVEQQARQAARLGLRILHGTATASLPVTVSGDNQFMFDHLALLRYGISLAELPPGSLIENRQYSLWELHRGKIIAVLVLILSLSLIIAVLIWLNRRLIAARLALSQLNADLESRVEERTAVLSQTNHRLEQEINERMQSEAELRHALSLVRQMEGILPICSFCKKIRGEDGSWQMLENFIGSRSKAEFSHGCCPDCARKHYPQYFS